MSGYEVMSGAGNGNEMSRNQTASMGSGPLQSHENAPKGIKFDGDSPATESFIRTHPLENPGTVGVFEGVRRAR